jgi:hypothetical protein
MIEPIGKLEDAYGTMDTPEVEGSRLAELRAKIGSLRNREAYMSTIHDL